LENENDFVGDLTTDLNIKNKQLYKIEYAPLCRICDAYQCKRCVWLNRKTTMEVNTPSHEQCVVAHLERNASRELLSELKPLYTEFPFKEIEKINYLDPFDIKENF
jgi:CXXX repeat peptide maturase